MKAIALSFCEIESVLSQALLDFQGGLRIGKINYECGSPRVIILNSNCPIMVDNNSIYNRQA